MYAAMRIEVRGLRSSWETVATNPLFEFVGAGKAGAVDIDKNDSCASDELLFVIQHGHGVGQQETAPWPWSKSWTARSYPSDL